MHAFSATEIEKIIREAGGQRVSAGAIAQSNSIVTEYGSRIAKRALGIMANSGRKTMREEDIKLALSK